MDVLNPSNFSKTRQIDCAEGWTIFINQLFDELTILQSDWAREMFLDLSTLMHVSSVIERECRNKDSTDIRCKRKLTYSNPNEVTWGIMIDKSFAENKQNKRKGKPVFVLQDYISTMNQAFKGDTCSFCLSEMFTQFGITKYPIILKIVFEKTDFENGTISDTPVSFPIQLSMNNINYELIAMHHHVDSNLNHQEDIEGHNFATVLRQGLLFEVDDETVKKRKIPKTGLFKDNSIVSVVYQRADWQDVVRDPSVMLHESPRYPFLVHKIYESLAKEINDRKETIEVRDSLLSGKMVIDKG
jgi:hypothetical protein